MLKKILIILSCILFLSHSIYATNHSEENVSEKLYIDIGGWCPGIPVEFEIYDLKEWENRTEIKNDDDINFTIFQNVDVNIHSGPFDSMETLFSQEVDERTFSHTFQETGNFLMTANNNNQEYEEFQTFVEIIPCRGQNVIEEDEEKIFEFPEENAIIKIENNSNQDLDVILQIVDESSYQQYPGIENIEKMLEITLSQSQDDKIQMITTLQNINPDITQVLSLDEESGNWNEIEHQNNNQEIIFESTQSGIFALVSQNEKEEEILNQENTSSSLNNNQTQNTTENTELTLENLESVSQESTDGNNSIIFIIIGVIVLVGVLILVITNKKKDSNHIFNTPKDEEILTSYNQEYERTKNYVKQYKDSYSADQIKTALVQANIHEDIIHKVFLEENVKVHTNTEDNKTN